MDKWLRYLSFLFILSTIVSCGSNEKENIPSLPENICGVSIGASIEESIDSLKGKGFSPQITGQGISFIEVNQKIPVKNLVFDKLTAYAYTSGVMGISLTRRFDSNSNAEAFYNNIIDEFKDLSSLSQPCNQAQTSAYLKCAAWSDTIKNINMDTYIDYHPVTHTNHLILQRYPWNFGK